ncbi:hypothetical protein [Glutamicibacter protophormiae]|uniref:hypothetical protein n=1 Tax=Glutamicibacter protophormiae TaxID=37930 RepID=UPI00361A2C7F
MDQFTFAERATDWRGNNNIAESVFAQMSAERYPIPSWIVVGAGTGGTSATFGRFVRYKRHDTKVAVADPRAPPSTRAGAPATWATPRAWARGSRASAARASSRPSCPGSSTR